MSICPFAVVKLLPESRTQPAIDPRISIAHSAAGKGSLEPFFRNSSNLESHFWISFKGQIQQYMDTNVRADANYHANGFAVSFETESSVSATEPWTPEQVEAIVRLNIWLKGEHHIPAIKAAKWDGSGMGYHIQFGAPGPWTPVSKSCPGKARIAQMPNIIARVAAGVQGDPNAGRQWAQFAKGATDKALYAKGYRNDMVKEVQLGLKLLGYTTAMPTGSWSPGWVQIWYKFLQDQHKVNPSNPAFKTPSSLVSQERVNALRWWLTA